MRSLRAAAVASMLASAGLAPAAARPTVSASGETVVAPGLLAMTAPVSCRRFADVARRAAGLGYRFPSGEGVCRRGPDGPAVALGWNTAAVWANALSALSGLEPAYRDAGGAVVTESLSLGTVPAAAAGSDGYRLPTLAELGLPLLREQMPRDVQMWTTSRIDLGDGRPYYYMCKPGACDFHSSGTSGRGVGFLLVRQPRTGGSEQAAPSMHFRHVNHSPQSAHPSGQARVSSPDD